MESAQHPSSSDVSKLPADPFGDVAAAAALQLATWGEIEVALTPIIGQQGVAALYRRSVHLKTGSHPWLSALIENSASNNSAGNTIGSTSGGGGIDLDALRSVLLRQDAAVASAAGDAVLRTFFELLTNLIGASLTERLLHSVWVNFLSDSSQQDSLP